MNIDKIDLAATALLHEIAEPGETHGGTAVGNGGGAELGVSAGELLHVGLPAGDGLAGSEIGATILGVLIGLVKAKEVFGSRGDGRGGGGRPALSV